MGVHIDMGNDPLKKIELQELEKWRKKRSNRAPGVFYTGILFIFSIHTTLTNDSSLFVTFMTIGICFIPFFICVLLFQYAKSRVKKLENL